MVAALNGVALGGGAELAIACDFRLAASHAAIGFVQAQLAITTGFGGVADLQATIGSRKAMGLMLAAQILKAPEALELGLFDAVARAGMDPVRRAAVGEEERARFIRAWTSEEHWAATEHLLTRRS